MTLPLTPLVPAGLSIDPVTPIGGAQIDIREFRVKGDDSDESAEVQAAIDACNAEGGGEIFCPVPKITYRCNVILKSGVILRGAQTRVTPFTPRSVLFASARAGYVIDTPASSISGCGVIGIGLQGLGAGTAGGGIRFQNVSAGKLYHIVANNFADEAVLLQAGTIACDLDQIFAQNCVLNRSRASVIGAVDVAGADHWLDRLEATISGSIEGHVQSAGLYCAAIAIRMANGMVGRIVGEISDVGIYVSGTQNRFGLGRADLNYGHGWLITGSLNTFASCLGLNNSQDTTNTYDNWQFANSSVTNVTVGCVAASTVAKVARYGFNDLVTSASGKNRHVAPVSFGAATAQYNGSSNHGSSFSFPSASAETLTANSATPDVTGYERFITANTAPTTITDFTGGVDGQRIVVWCNDANTTIQHNGSTIVTFNGGNVKLVSGRIYAFVKSGAWRLESFGEAPQVSADNGDAAKTIQARTSEATQVWATPLTANRAVTLSATGAYNGAKFRVVRKASATGASTLDVGTGPLKSLAAGQWCDVEYDGAAWLLSAFGSL